MKVEGQLIMDLNHTILYLVRNARSVTIIEGTHQEKSSVSLKKPGESIFKGIGKAKAAHPLDHAGAGLFHVDVVSVEYVTQRFTGTTISEALGKARGWIDEHA